MNRDTNTVPPSHGPYHTEREAFDDAELIYTAARRDRMRGSMTRASAAALRDALSAAGVELGAYDQTVLLWLAGWEPQMVQAVIGWTERANGGTR